MKKGGHDQKQHNIFSNLLSMVFCFFFILYIINELQQWPSLAIELIAH